MHLFITSRLAYGVNHLVFAPKRLIQLEFAPDSLPHQDAKLFCFSRATGYEIKIY
jgi:hypothetical protein